MGRSSCCDKIEIKKGPWTPEEDIMLVSYIQEHGPGNWRSVPTNSGNFQYQLLSVYLFSVLYITFQTPFTNTTNFIYHFFKGLIRCSKSCRLRWTNYLRPGIKRGNFTEHEEKIIVHLQALLGNRYTQLQSSSSYLLILTLICFHQLMFCLLKKEKSKTSSMYKIM